MQFGKIQTLTVDRITDAGYFLVDDEGDDVLLPYSLATDQLDRSLEVDVFVYTDSKSRPIATMHLPFAEVDSFAVLEVVSVNPVGAFVSIGIAKEVLLPYKEQSRDVKAGDRIVVYIYIDDMTNRLVSTMYVERYLADVSEEHQPFEEEEAVEIIIYRKSNLGWNAIILPEYKGLLYENEVFEPLSIGDRKTAYIKKVREDYNIDLSLRRSGYIHTNKTADQIITALQSNNGYLPLHDKSDPALIYDKLQMSKKAFKKAVGLLYKDRLITLEDDGIRLRLNQ